MIDLGIALLCPGTGLMMGVIIPDDRVPVEVERPGSEEGAEGDDEGDVEHGRTHHAANTHRVLTWFKMNYFSKM